MAKATASAPFVDTRFKAEKKSLLWSDVGEAWGSADKVDKWVRLSEKYGSNKYSLFGSKGVTPKDIYQGSIGNCWFMSAMSAIAEKPNRIENMFLNTSNSIEAKGIYGVNMYALGVPITIIVDDFIPMYTSKSTGFDYPLFADVAGDNSVWGAIMEKAFAKFYGSYKNTVGGVPRMAVRSLVGGPYEDFWHLDEKGKTGTTV